MAKKTYNRLFFVTWELLHESNLPVIASVSEAIQ